MGVYEQEALIGPIVQKKMPDSFDFRLFAKYIFVDNTLAFDNFSLKWLQGSAYNLKSDRLIVWCLRMILTIIFIVVDI